MTSPSASQSCSTVHIAAPSAEPRTTAPQHSSPYASTTTLHNDLENPYEDIRDISPGSHEADQDQRVLPDLPVPPQTQIPFRSRNHSSSNTFTSMRAEGSLASLPPMQRANSSPGIDSSGRFVYLSTTTHNAPRRPSSPLTAGRRRSPLRSSYDELFQNSWSNISMEPNIPENAELDIFKVNPDDTLRSMASIASHSNTFPRSRRRPASPLHQSASAPSLYARAASPHRSGTTSPALMASKYSNEVYPSYSYGSTSSMPSTPTSLRSRSPSISSLDTIEDSPDAEEAAMIEAEEAKLRGEEADPYNDTRRRSLELRGNTLRSNKERKRWSVSGAERRADFSLEPIEE